MTAQGVGKVVDLPNGCVCAEGMAPQFDYHGEVEVESAQIDHVLDRVVPLNGLNLGPYEFNFESHADYFLDLSSLHMHAQVQVVTEAGEALTDADNDKVWPADNLLNSLWSTVETKINNVIPHPETSSKYAFRAQIEYLLSVEEAKKSCYITSGFGESEETRKTSFRQKQKKPFNLCGPIALDILRSDQHLAPGNKLAIHFHRAEHDFSLITAENVDTKYKILVKDICVYGNRIRLRPDLTAKILSSNGGVQHHLTTHSEVKDYPLPQGINKWNIKLYAGGLLPYQIVVGFVATTAFNGAYGQDPFKFEPFGLNEICLRLNGTRLPQDPLRPDFANARLARTYLHLYQNTGKFRVNGGNSITYDAFQRNAFLVPFDLTPDQCNNFHRHAARDGSMDMELGWAAATEQPLTVVVLCIFNQVLQLQGETVPPIFSIY